MQRACSGNEKATVARELCKWGVEGDSTGEVGGYRLS